MKSLWRDLKELNRHRGNFYLTHICSTRRIRATVVLFSLMRKKNRESSRRKNTVATPSSNLSAKLWLGRMLSKTLWDCRHFRAIGGWLNTGTNLEFLMAVTSLINTQTVTWTLKLSLLMTTKSRSRKSLKVRKKQWKSSKKRLLMLVTRSHKRPPVTTQENPHRNLEVKKSLINGLNKKKSYLNVVTNSITRRGGCLTPPSLPIMASRLSMLMDARTITRLWVVSTTETTCWRITSTLSVEITHPSTSRCTRLPWKKASYKLKGCVFRPSLWSSWCKVSQTMNYATH